MAPFTSEHIFIHTTYRDPIPVLRNVTKEITVSHWDTIKVDEFVHMENEIAKLAGEFGRVDYNPFDVAYAISEVTCNLPLNAHHLYYVDPVGNVTTSHARKEDDKVLFEFKPRFPIMGGWKATWNQGYSLPARSSIKQSVDDHSLHVFKIQLAHSFDEIVAGNFTIKIVLPEGATDVAVKLPFEMNTGH